MEMRRFGKTGLDVSVLGFGGAEIGYQGVDQETATRLLNAALDAGLNVIDTAECYVDSEELIGNAVSGRRGEFLLFTKTGHADGYANPDWSYEGTLATVERSLKRLKTDHVDLVLLHSCGEEELRRGDATRGLQEAKRRGYTRLIGYSGDSAAARYAVESGAFDALEVSVNIADQEAIDLVLPEAVRRGLGVIAKRPVANVAWRSGGQPPADTYHHEYWRRLRELDYDFAKGDLDEAVAVALRFTLGVPGVDTAIVGTTKPDRFGRNAEVVAAGPLPEDRFRAIRERWGQVARPDWTGQT
ncbi:MAG TPA: aldo/keto reductase [Planctomycetaceae bacterium]